MILWLFLWTRALSLFSFSFLLRFPCRLVKINSMLCSYFLLCLKSLVMSCVSPIWHTLVLFYGYLISLCCLINYYSVLCFLGRRLVKLLLEVYVDALRFMIHGFHWLSKSCYFNRMKMLYLDVKIQHLIILLIQNSKIWVLFTFVATIHQVLYKKF